MLKSACWVPMLKSTDYAHVDMLRLQDYAQVDMLGPRYKFGKFTVRARAHQIPNRHCSVEKTKEGCSSSCLEGCCCCTPDAARPLMQSGSMAGAKGTWLGCYGLE